MRREILYSEGGGEAWAAVVEDAEVVEVSVEREGWEPAAGDVFSGIVRRIMPGMQAAFVDIGAERAAFVHVSDVPAGLAPEAPAGDGRIGDLLRDGQKVLVQITKEPLPDKGARATMQISLPGRLLVAVPSARRVALSRRIESQEVLERLSAIMERIAPAGEGWIVRTAAAEATEAELAAEAGALRREWTAIERGAQSRRPPALLRREEEALGRFLRDLADEHLDAILADGEGAFERARERVEALAPAALSKLERARGRPGTLMEVRGVRAAVQRALRPRIRLPSGATIVISQTEALVAVDVNTGRFTGGDNQEETALATNLEAALEVARQIRLRNLGGIIVVDFIDLEQDASRRQVVDALAEALAWDRSRSRILEMSSFGLVQITRPRRRLTLERVLTDVCPCCRGSGRVKGVRLLARDIRAALAGRNESERAAGWIVRLHPAVASHLHVEELSGGDDERLGPVRIERDPEMPVGRFSVEPAGEDGGAAR